MALIMSMGGGAPKRTVLWTNPDPTTGNTQTSITLNEDASHFDLIEFKWCAAANLQDNINYLYLKSDFTTAGSSHTAIQGRGNTSVGFTTRQIEGISGTTVTLTHDGNSGGAIITEITGIKF